MYCWLAHPEESLEVVQARLTDSTLTLSPSGPRSGKPLSWGIDRLAQINVWECELSLLLTTDRMELELITLRHPTKHQARELLNRILTAFEQAEGRRFPGEALLHQPVTGPADIPRAG